MEINLYLLVSKIRKIMFYKRLIILAFFMLFFGCGSSDLDTSVDVDINVINELTEVPPLNSLSMSLNPLSKMLKQPLSNILKMVYTCVVKII